jgi:hypothetical protein
LSCLGLGLDLVTRPRWICLESVEAEVQADVDRSVRGSQSES